MSTPPCHWIDFGNLAIGIGTFTLAIVLAIVNWRSSNRDRKVHIADKRHDWLKEFRSDVAEFLTAMDAADMVNDFGGGEEEKRNIVRKQYLIVNKLSLLMDEKSGHTDMMLDHMAEMTELIMVNNQADTPDEKKKYREKVQDARIKIFEVSKRIISEEWEKIKKLED